MSATAWLERTRPPSLERRFDFPDYATLREFLDATAAIFEAEDYYPNMTFSRHHVVVTIFPEGDSDRVTDRERYLAERIDAVAGHASDAPASS
jgi:pterin-4a-carbinolamine dehydratase